jgi:DnaJ-class molecular chaperone
MSERNFYELMEVEQDATVDQIKDQFTILEATFDSLGGDVVKSLKRARDILTVPSSREMYDKKLKGAMVLID